jgi:membrane-associated phospholipid phosphatase
MESDIAAGINTAVAGLAIGVIDARWSPGESGRDIGQGQLLYWSGLLSMKGIQDAVKGQVARQRPLARLAPEVAARREHVDAGRDQRSFWSGHASSAFYASTFLNLRIREALRRELGADDYRAWRWAPPVLLFSWSAWIAWSRVDAYHHYLSDVVVGSLAGWAFAELFHSLDGRGDDATAAAKARPLIGFTVLF